VTRLPDSLIRFGGDLESAIARDLRVRRSARRRRSTAGVVVALAAAAGIGGAVVALPGHDAPIVGGIVDPALASERAVAAISPAAGSLVHEVAAHRSVRPDGHAIAWRDEEWRETAPPYRRREVTTRADGSRIETAAVGSGPAQLYDAASDTIYTVPGPGAALGTPVAAGEGDPMRSQIVQMLRSGAAGPVSRQVVGGRDAIRFIFRDAAAGDDAPTWTYTVDATTYRPIRLVVADAGGATDTVAFERYEATGDDPGLLSLRAAHPDAAVDATRAGYAAALSRLR
jgi:hypothetical protein